MISEKYKNTFTPDGSLRDVIVLDCDSGDWIQLFNTLIKQNYVLSLKKDGDATTLSLLTPDLLKNNDHNWVLEINLDNVIINCFFYDHKDIEMDIDPREIITDDHAHKVLQFIFTVGSALKKDVFIVDESEDPLHFATIKYSHIDARIHFL